MAVNSSTEALDLLRKSLANAAPVAELDQAIATVAAFKEKTSVGPLLSMLDDGAAYDESMFSLIHAAESFDDVTYVRAFLGVIPEIGRSAPRWASIVLMRILNNEATKRELIVATRDASSEAKSVITWLCEAINERGAEFVSKTLPVMIASRN